VGETGFGQTRLGLIRCRPLLARLGVTFRLDERGGREKRFTFFVGHRARKHVSRLDRIIARSICAAFMSSSRPAGG
jgi:hypothetical protein